MDARQVSKVEMALGAMLVAGVGLTFAPWLRSGSSRRSSYGVVRAADRLDVLGDRWGAVLRGGWSFVPLVAALALVALTMGWSRAAAGLAALMGLAEGFLALAVMGSPRSADWGARGGLAAGVVLVTLATAIGSRSNR